MTRPPSMNAHSSGVWTGADGEASLVSFASTSELFAPRPTDEVVAPTLGLVFGPPTALLGVSGCGKSLAAMALGLAVALGRSWLGVYPMRRGRYLHLDYRLGKRETCRRVRRLTAGFGADAEALRGWLDVAIDPPLTLGLPDAEERFARAFDTHALAVIDSLEGAASGHPPESAAMGDCLRTLSRASERTGCAVVVVHRPVTLSVPSAARRAARGPIVDECQSVFVLAKTADAVHVHHEKDRELGRTLAPFAFRFVDVGAGDDPRAGLRVESVDRTGAMPGPSGLPSADNRVIERVRACIRDHPGIAGVEAVRERVGLKAATVRAAIGHLSLTREVISLAAPRNGVRLYLRNQAPPTFRGEKEEP